MSGIILTNDDGIDAPGLAALWRATSEQWRQVFGGRSLRSVLRTHGAPSR